MTAENARTGPTESDLAALADAGELAAPLAHEVNNYLNLLLLQISVLELRVPPEARPDLAEVRRQGKLLAELVKHWQRSRSLQNAPSRAIDFNNLLEQLVAETRAAASSVSVHLNVAPSLPCICGVYEDVRRLCRFLLKNAISAAQQGHARVTIRTAPMNGTAQLRVEDTGPALPLEALPQFFEASFAGRPGTDSLELAACAGIVRRLNGTIVAEKLPEGGVAVIVHLPTR